ncbi:hypothetical protein RF11_15534 [Thelohanellus kitauei]|uniref:Uncharacterized protein n=1 Tax=Thelohanellus kitauei TaxID=669202 RepID=A0A0C2MLJ8_THEKT|nr:hypothetical protein RF11_15534 [Thelohanellus kitauei]
MRLSMRTVFKHVPAQSHIDYVVSIIKASAGDYSRIESCLFFVSGMITDTLFPVDFHEILDMILKCPTDAPSPLIEIYCKFLKDFTDHFDRQKKSSDVPTRIYDSIFRWLAQVPGSATKILGYEVDYSQCTYDKVKKDLQFINNIIVFCSELSVVETLGKFMADMITNMVIEDSDDIIGVFGSLVNFYSHELLQVSRV